MHKGFLKTAALLAAVAVIIGAFAAHSLKGKVGDHALTTFQTAVTYQFYHVFALFLTAIVYKDFNNNITKWAGRLFIAGIILFCGSLYYLSFIQAIVKPAPGWAVALTPAGGFAFIGGWVLLFLSFFKKHNSSVL